MKKSLCVTLMLTLFSLSKIIAQDSTAIIVDSAKPAPQPKVKKDTRPFMKRLHFGIGTSFWVNPSNTYFEFSPLLTYHFPKTYSIGVGPVYIYNRDRNNDEDLHGWGGRLYGQANFTSWLYGYTEYQGIDNQHITGFSNNKPVKESWYVDSWFVSLGLNVPVGRRRHINVQILYDMLYKESTSYMYSPVIYRLGFGL